MGHLFMEVPFPFYAATSTRFLMTDTGSVTIPLYHCVFNNDGESITHWATTFDCGLYESLPHLYLVCVADNGGAQRRIVGAFMVKTSRHHEDAGFAEAMNLAAAQMEHLRPLLGSTVSMLPARIGLEGEPPSEVEFLRLAITQYTKFSVSGRA